MQNIIAALEAEINARERELDRLKAALAELKDHALPPVEVDKNQFAGMRCSQAARAYLQKKGSGAHLDEIREALLRGGLDMGIYPRRTVKLAIVSSPKRFDWTGDEGNPFVTLK